MSKQTHFILDEAGALGRMPVLDDAVDKYRGYGVRLLFFYQSLGQLKKCWPDDQGQTLLSNTSKVFFGCNDYPTAEFICKSLGNETIIVESGGHNSGWTRNRSSTSGSSSSETSGSSYSGGSSSNWQPQSRELLKPDEIIALDPRIAITLTPGVRPLWTRLIRYYQEKTLLTHRGFLTRMTAACWTLFLSAVLLFIAGTAAAALTGELRDTISRQQKQQMTPAGNEPQPWLIPGESPEAITPPKP